MSQELSAEISPEIINSLILTGDMSKLTPAQQTAYYNAVCKTLDLNPLTQPFAIIVLQGKKTLYATKGCTQQLANIRKISTEVLSREVKDSVYIVSVRATLPDGRKTDEDGIVGVAGLKGGDLANAMLKAITKAKRRAVLALCGLNMADETEIEDVRHTTDGDLTKSRVESIIDAQVEQQTFFTEKDLAPEVKDAPKEKKPKETTKKKSKDAPVVNEGATTEALPEGHKVVQGVITAPAKYAEIGEQKTPKWVFTMGDLKLGTFDKSVFEAISQILDLQKDTPILLNIEYKERQSGDKILKDIVKFSQVTA